MALVVTGALPFILSGSVLFYVAATSADAGNSKLFASANQAVSDAFSSIRVVQSYRLQSHVRNEEDRGAWGGCAVRTRAPAQFADARCRCSCSGERRPLTHSLSSFSCHARAPLLDD